MFGQTAGWEWECSAGPTAPHLPGSCSIISQSSSPCCYFLVLYLPAFNFRFLRLPYPSSPCPSSPCSLPPCSSSCPTSPCPPRPCVSSPGPSFPCSSFPGPSSPCSSPSVPCTLLLHHLPALHLPPIPCWDGSARIPRDPSELPGCPPTPLGAFSPAVPGGGGGGAGPGAAPGTVPPERRRERRSGDAVPAH